MQRRRKYILILLCLLVPLRTLAEPMACMAMPHGSDVAGASTSMSMSTQTSDARHQCPPASAGGDTAGERATHCHCVALSGWWPVAISSAHEVGSVAIARCARDIAEHFAPRIWRPPAVHVVSS
jgi:hypothetical protein